MQGKRILSNPEVPIHSFCAQSSKNREVLNITGKGSSNAMFNAFHFFIKFHNMHKFHKFKNING